MTMKKILPILLLIAGLLTAGNPVDAKTNKKKSKKKSVPVSVIGKFPRYGDTINLFSNGKAESQDKCTTGVYKIPKGGYYKVEMYALPQCGDGEFLFLIVDDIVYEIGAGSAGTITNCSYNPENKMITITEIDGGPVTPEELEYAGFSSKRVPLSEFEKLGEVTWTK